MYNNYMSELLIGSEIPILECRQFPEYCWEDMNGNYLGNYISSRFEERDSSTETVRRIECPDICPMCHDPITHNAAYYIHQPGTGGGLCQMRIHSNCQLLHVNRSNLENGKVLCMACRQPIGTIRASTQMVLNQERGVWKDALRNIDDELFPPVQINLRNVAIVILSGLLIFVMSDAFDEYMYYTFMTRTNNGGTRKKTRILKGGFKGKMKTREEIQEFSNIIIQLQKKENPFHIMLEGNKKDIHKLLNTNRIITKIIN
jgi:hypothetical protein